MNEHLPEVEATVTSSYGFEEGVTEAVKLLLKQHRKINNYATSSTGIIAVQTTLMHWVTSGETR